MSGTFGPLFDGLSKSAALQSSLESRLRARLDVHGSPEYVLTWKSWGMPVGPPICALRASQRRTSGKGFTGWPTPRATEIVTGDNAQGGLGLTSVAQTVGWPTTTTMDHIEREGLRPSRIATNRTGGYIAEVLAGWATPNLPAPHDSENTAGDARIKRHQHGPEHQAFGMISESSSAETESTGASRLNPRFSLWLMGLPPDEWASCAVLGTP
jgi:hypothetical protein